MLKVILVKFVYEDFVSNAMRIDEAVISIGEGTLRLMDM